MNAIDKETLKGYSNQKCPDCKSNILVEIVQAQVIGTCQNNECKKIWLFNEVKNGNINSIEALEVSGLIEFYVELPFNLSLSRKNF